MLAESRNCWRVAPASRAAFLIDADAYFSAFRQAVAGARHTVMILGWDIDTRTRLSRPGEEPVWTLLPFLNHVLDRQPDLRVYALAWDYSVIYTLEREPLPTLRFAHAAHPRLSFHLDSAHPLGASHHQKIVVVDDEVAFTGGLDLTIRRWDLSAHRAHEPDRVDPAGQPYPPVHDVQMVVEGQAAEALGAIARARWEAATGEVIAAAPRGGAPVDLWPAGVTPDITDAPIGIARTLPERDTLPAVTEVVDLTRDMIAAAQRWIYIENQYLTSAAVGSMLARSLGQEHGPEVVIVLPREEHGWLEQSSMGILRARLLRRLAQSDRYGRLRLYYPTVPELDAGCMNVHSKVMIVDGVVARVGSANLSNRSMGLDSECDLVLDVALDPRLGPVVEHFRDRLLSEHLGVDRQVFADALAARGSLIAAVEGLRGAPRTLDTLPIPADPDAGAGAAPSIHLAFLDGLVCDPERPAADLLVETFVPTGLRTPVHRSLRGWVALVVALLVVAAVWRFTPLRGLLHIERMTALLRRITEQPATPAWVLGGYLVGGLIFFPITLLLGATALVFRPLPAIAYCLTGTLASAAVTYWIGRLIGHVRADWLRGPRLTRFEKQLRHRGVLAIVAARLLPVGNFSLINMAAGAFRIGFGDYMLGNAIGVLPGILALTLFADRLGSTLRHPRGTNLAMLAAVALALVAVLSWIRRRLARHV
ncbi:MAG: VTT domain-containing protein [Polyangia bacterium]